MILAVVHTQFAEFSVVDTDALFGAGQKILLDLKGLLDRKVYEDAGYFYWRL